jgi:hypothetical protein
MSLFDPPRWENRSKQIAFVEALPQKTMEKIFER